MYLFKLSPTLKGAALGLFITTFITGAPAYAQTSATPNTPTTALGCPYIWATSLRLGSNGEAVLHLQQFLNSSPDTQVAAAGAGSPGHETASFGVLTQKAIVKFQEKYMADILTPSGLSKGTGLVGPATRAKLNALCGGQVSTGAAASSPAAVPTPNSSTPTLVITSAAQPAHELAPAGALYVPTTAITLTAQGGDMTVNKILVKRIGASSDNAISYVSLLDEAGSELSYAFLHSDHTATFSDSFDIPAGTSMTVTVAANMAADLTDYDGQQIGFEIDTVDASVPPVGTLPIVGTLQTTNESLVIGTALAELSQFDPNNATTHYINDTNVRFSGIKITAGNQEDLTLHSISWRSSGTADISDLSNLFVVVSGQTYSTSVDDKYVTADFGPTGIKIAKGNSVEGYIQGNVGVGAANRTVQFDIDYATDVSIIGNTYGYGIYLLPGGNTAQSGNSVFLTDDGETSGVSLMPFFKGSPATINSGTATNIGRN